MGRKRGSAPGAVLRVVISNDYRLLLGAMRAVLEPEADIEVVGATHEAERVLALVAELDPDLLLLGHRMPGLDGLAFLERLRAAYPAVTVVLLTESPDPEVTAAALAHGANGVIPKSADPDELAPALRAAIRGESPRPELSPPDAAESLGLTPREKAVLMAMGRGLSNAEIARELSIGNSTVKFHLYRAFDKLDVTTRLEALRVMTERALFGNHYDWL